VDRPVARPVPAAPSGSLSPRARRFAAEHDFHPASVTGSGPVGRVLEDDLRKQYYSSPRVSSLANKRIEEGMEVGGAGSGTAGMVLSSDLVPPATRLSGIREKIARRMRESLASTAQYTLHTSANAAGLLLMRAKIKASTGVPDININDLVTFCAIQALLEVPDVNAEFIDGRIYRHREIHIGFACDTPRGLMVPVVRDAHKLTAGELSVRMKELIAQTVQGTVSVDDLSGATFTVSNLGGLGIESFTPLLNPPQVAILGVDSIQLKPVRRDGRIEFIDAIGLSITLDHQVIDGAPGARFLKVVKEKIENVESLCTI
jgi:pyruvate dehydrogenase E2 component (dihydrolipoamide acetyltransferase)